MKKFLFLLIAGVLCIHSVAYGISMTGLKSSGILGPKSHTHVTTKPSRIYAITVIPTATNGFAQIIETNSVLQDASDAGSHYISGKPAKVMADIQGAIANTSIHFEYEDGINVAGQMFVDVGDAQIIVYYKE